MAAAEDHALYRFYGDDGALLKATAHLMGKTWLEHTNWKEVIERAGGGAT